MLAHCERGVKANKKQRLSSKPSGPAPENINAECVLTAQSEPFPRKKKKAEKIAIALLFIESAIFFSLGTMQVICTLIF